MPDSVSQAERDEAIRQINEVLIKRKYDRNKYVTPVDPTQVYSIDNPGSGQYQDDPIGSFAMQEFARQNPDTYNRASAIHVGRPVLATNHGSALGTTWKNIMTGEPVISLLHSDKTHDPLGPFAAMMNTIRHEYGHVMGLNDEQNPILKDPTTYDVGNWSDTLHKDIQLPSPREQDPMQKMGSMMPTTKVKVR